MKNAAYCQGWFLRLSALLPICWPSGRRHWTLSPPKLGTSPRTLSPKLTAEEIRFFRVLEDLRKSLSRSFLRDSDLVLAEIAFLLCYSELSSFTDAIKC